MDKPKMIQAMKASISEVLEQMFFLPIDLVDAGKEKSSPAIDGGETYTAKVGFQGPASGVFRLQIPAALAASISADFLGTLTEELSDEDISGTVKEMLNMLAGNSLSAYDPKAPFNLSIPELTQSPAGGEKAGEKRERIDIRIETMDSCMSLNMTA